MASYPPPYNDWKSQRRILRDQARVQRMQLRSLRRSSVIGPLLIISIGVLFLLVQLGKLPSLAVWSAFGRWWPLLLIGIGIIRLVEWLVDQRGRRQATLTGTPYASHNLGAGISFLVVLLVLAGLGLSVSQRHAARLFGRDFQINQDNLDEFFGEKHESDHPLVQPCPEGTLVTIDNPRGDVTIAGTSDDGQLHVEAHDEVFTRSDSEAANKAQQLTPRIDRNGNQLSVVLPVVEGGRVDLTVTLPTATPVTARVNRGDVRIHTLRAPVNVIANHGDVDLSALSGSVTARINNGDSSFSAHSVTGDLSLEGRSLDITLSDIHGAVALNGEFFGTVHLERTVGGVKFHTSRVDLELGRLDGELEISPNADITADQVLGPLILNTRNRNINLERVAGDLSVTNRNGSINVTAAPPLGNVMIENRNGEIDLTVPSASSFTVQAETVNASINNDFGLSANEDEENRPKLTGTVGKGGPVIHLTTSQSDISLHRGTIAPLPPVPPTSPRLTSLPPEAEKSLEEGRKALQDAQHQVKAAEDSAQKAAERGRKEAEKAAHSAHDSADDQ